MEAFMGNRVYLSTIALLSTLWEQRHEDYLDILSSFVLCCLPRQIDTKVDIDELTNAIKTKYGFDDMPRQVVEKILSRLCRQTNQPKPYLRKSNHEFYIVNVYDREEFQKRQNETNNVINDVLLALSEYLKRNNFQRDISIDDASYYLYNFFDSYGLTIVHDSNMLRSITTDSGKYNFYVARFIIENNDKRTPIFDKLLQITKGFLVHKAVYFYSNELKSSPSSKLGSVKLFLDCSLVIDALGYDSDGDEKACDDMLSLIKSCGGQVCVFSHTVEEASHVLHAYAVKPHASNSFMLENLDARKYPQDILESLATEKSIEATLKKKGIQVIDAPSYTHIDGIPDSRQYAGVEDEEAIEKQLLSQYSSIERTDTSDRASYDTRVKYDTQSLSAISRIRRGYQPSSLEKCKAIIISQSSMLNQCMHNLYPKRFSSEIDFAIKDVDLVSLLWLGQQNRKSQLPQNLLISYAVAACQLSQDIMDQAIKLAVHMEEDNTIPSEAALIIRSQAAIRHYIFNETHNNPSSLTENTIEKVIKEYISNETEEASRENITKAVNEKEKELKAGYEAELAQIKSQHDKEHRQQILEMQKDAENHATQIANLLSKITRYGLYTITLVSIIFSIYCWIVGGFSFNNFAAIVLSLLSLFQIIDYLLKFANITEKLTIKVKNCIFAKPMPKKSKKERIWHIFRYIFSYISSEPDTVFIGGSYA